MTSVDRRLCRVCCGQAFSIEVVGFAVCYVAEFCFLYYTIQYNTNFINPSLMRLFRVEVVLSPRTEIGTDPELSVRVPSQTIWLVFLDGMWVSSFHFTVLHTLTRPDVD